MDETKVIEDEPTAEGEVMDIKDIQDLAERQVTRGSTKAEVGALIVLTLVEVIKALELIHERMPPRE